MELNLDLIADELRGRFELVLAVAKHEDLILEQPLLFSGQTLFESGKVYVARGGELPVKPFFSGPCAVVSIGPAQKIYREFDCDYIELPEHVSIADALNCIQEAYAKYGRWRDALRDAVIHEQGVQRLLDLTVPLLGNPIYFHDNNYRFLASAEVPGMAGGSDIYRIKENGGMFSPEALSILKNTPSFQKTFETTRPTFHIDIGECNYIYDNIWLNGQYRGRIFVDERVRAFQKSDYAVVGELRRTIERAMSTRNLFEGSHCRTFDQTVVRMLDGEAVDIGGGQSGRLDPEWDRFQSWFCFQLHMHEVDHQLNTRIATCEMIESRMTGCFAFPYREHIVGIFCATGKEDVRRPMSARLDHLLGEFKLHMGVSLMMDDFADLPRYYEQTNIALRYGIREETAGYTHFFEEHSFGYMLDCCVRDMPAQMLYPPALNKLIEYEKEKSVPYVETLRAYLESGSSPAKAMKKLYVQRSTFLYRLERISECIGTDFEDEKTRIHFLLAFRLMDYVNSHPPK